MGATQNGMDGGLNGRFYESKKNEREEGAGRANQLTSGRGLNMSGGGVQTLGS